MRSSVASTRDRIGPTQVRPFDRGEASRDQSTCYAISAVLAIIAVTSRRRPASPLAVEMDSNYWSRHGETPYGHAMWFPRTAPPAWRGTDPESDEKFEFGFLQRR